MMRHIFFPFLRRGFSGHIFRGGEISLFFVVCSFWGVLMSATHDSLVSSFW